jgi:predicted short-subunit dehydrogenase-like oxidoreductase (DUF2520 family)
MPRTPRKRAKASVSIIGAGRLGQALALALHASGYPVLGLVARRTRKAEAAVRLLPKSNPRPLALSVGQLRRLPPSDLTLICTPDDAIEGVVRQLASYEIEKPRLRIVLHTSGALSSKVLAPLAKAGFHTGSMHPLVSVSEPHAGAKALRGAFYCLEGDKAAMRLARGIVADLNARSFSMRPESKALYHAAAVMASPHLVALFDLAVGMLAACGLGRQNARKVLLPLVESTVENFKVSDTAKALTGTFARGDLATVARHLAALSDPAQSEALEVYRLLGLHSLKLASRKRLNSRAINEITRLLESRLNED